MGKRERQMRSQKFTNFLSVLAMILPPWNIFWWLYGAVWYVYFKRHDDPNTDYGMAGDWSPEGQAFLAPIMFPADIICRYQSRKYHKYYKPQLIKAVEWIASELQKEGIGAKVYTDSPCIRAKLKKSQVNAYKEVYRRAVKEFPKIKIGDICRHSKPLAPLDKVWAETAGCPEYAEAISSPPCKQCGRQTIQSVFWGDDEDCAERHEIWANREVVEQLNQSNSNLYYQKHDGECVYMGYFCEECRIVVGKSLEGREDIRLMGYLGGGLNFEDLEE